MSTTSTTTTIIKPRTNENIYLFIPNLIGYTRIILAAASLTYMSSHPKFCTLTYLISCLLDAVDGMAARALGQTSKLGAILDMVTDRCTTSCLLCFLASAYPKLALLFQGLITLDFSSHYIHMYASLVSGSISHKIVTKKQSWILWSYYNNTTTLFIFCAGNELFFVALYLMQTPLGISSILTQLPNSLLNFIPPPPPIIIKSLPSGLINLTWPMLIALICFPICAGKQIINCVQFWKASKVLVESDQEERYIKFNNNNDNNKKKE